MTAAETTDRPGPKHLAAKPAAAKPPVPKPTTVHWWKLSVAIGLTALGYGVALRPVLASVGQAQGAQTARLQKELQRIAQQNAARAKQLKQDEAKLTATLKKENALRTEIAKVEAQKPPPLATASVPGVSVPAVHTTTGASGVP